ncbi:unnamed protein product [Bursaphelenchus xylophilus]|uniref:(pine wood nematode) hypothetical protein n=1 Tax=Bursaphelenchus xylophilus TaxID=6326 RepID=A0A1I7SGF8_BURXY|nr:unnamed protein product [Bursaphelenchus xylophilus]CAG9125157.1 unnamed protein product [Bursaphelenchus xylophilus]
MLKTKAVERYLGQATQSGVKAVLLFDQNGKIVARSGHQPTDSINAVFTAKLWDSFDRQGARDRLKEMVLHYKEFTILAAKAANMTIAMIAAPDHPMAICRAKLIQLVEDLREPLAVLG